MYMSFNMMNMKVELENTFKEKVTPLPGDSTEPMDWEWTPPSHTPCKNIIAEFELEVKIGGFTTKIPEQDTDEKAREQRAGSIPPPTPKATLGASQDTSRKHNKVTEDLPLGLCGSGSDAIQRNSREKGQQTAVIQVIALITPTVISVTMRVNSQMSKSHQKSY